eukprot:1020269-Amphidinium_carterae.1
MFILFVSLSVAIAILKLLELTYLSLQNQEAYPQPRVLRQSSDNFEHVSNPKSIGVPETPET